MNDINPIEAILQWFSSKKWKPLPFQLDAWQKVVEGKSGLISVPTGAGKTYAAYLPALMKLKKKKTKAIRILYITPLRALASDMLIALKRPVDELNLPYRVEKRTGDTTYSQKAKLAKNPPEILLTTPESLAVMLCSAEGLKIFADVEVIIIDEWHELLGSKRGVLLELNIARIKKNSSSTQIWGLTATIANKEEAAAVCVGKDKDFSIITTSMQREVILEPILPETIEKLPWAGQLGMRMLPYVVDYLNPTFSTLIFTNTRSQAERWYRAIIEARPEWEELTALHHSSIDKKYREAIEERLKNGLLRFVVCTSSLDLGIDLPEVEKVVQIGAPKSIARLIQRAGRSSHKPLTACRIALVPTHALEIVEIKAYRIGLDKHKIEERKPLKKCFDVLLQHMISCAIANKFEKESFFDEITSTYAFADLTKEEFEECLFFLVSGGKALEAYPEYKKLIFNEGKYCVEDQAIVRRHKMNIGTICSDAQAVVKWARGPSLGVIEEAFLMNLKPRDCFLFGGKRLELIQYRDMVAFVRLAKKNDNRNAAIWRGSRLPYSAPLGQMLREALDDDKAYNGVEEPFLKKICQLQHEISYLPHKNELLIENVKSKEGSHLFIYCFEGKNIHDGLAMLIAHRLSKQKRRTLTLSSNDYGFEIFCSKAFEIDEINNALFSSEDVEKQINELMNTHEAGRACFREICRIAGLVFQGFPGKNKSSRQLQMSSALLFDVFEKYDRENLLLKQAKQEVMERHFELERLEKVLLRLNKASLIVKNLHNFSPFALPLFIERMSDRLTTENLIERIENIKMSWTR